MTGAPEPPTAGARTFAWLLLLVAVPVALWFFLRPTPATDPYTPAPSSEASPAITTAALTSQPVAARPEPGLAPADPTAAAAAAGTVALTGTAVPASDAGPDVTRAPVRFDPEISLLVSVAQNLRHPGTQRASDAVNAQLAGLQSCYRESFTQGAALVGGLSARLHVEPAGPVSEVLVRGTLGGARGDAGADAELALRGCVERVLRTVYVPDLAPPAASAPDASVYAGSPTWADAGSHETGADVFVRMIFTRRLAAP